MSKITYGVIGDDGRVSWITQRVRAWSGVIGAISTTAYVCELELRSELISSDGGLLVVCELDGTLGLSNLTSAALRDPRRSTTMWQN